MRPRVFPAEDLGGPVMAGAATYRFNEAAGIPRGRLDGVASMHAGQRWLQ